MDESEAVSDELHLMELQVEALFTTDDVGRLVTINEPDGGPATRFFLGLTTKGNLWRFRHDVPEATARQLDALSAAEPTPDDLRAPLRNLAAFMEALQVDRESDAIESG